MLKKEDLPYCPIATLLRLIGSKWKILIIQQLENGDCRFNELLKSLPGISKYVLSESLHALENDGIIDRKTSPETPSQVQYGLNALGASLLPVLHQMAKWGIYYKECRLKILSEKNF